MRHVRPAAAAGLTAVAVAGVVFVVYVAVLAGTTVLFGGTLALGRPGLGPVVVATVVIALVVRPVQTRLRRWSRRVCGVAGTDPFDLLRQLPRSVTGELPAEDIPRHMVRVLGEGLRTSRCELWLRVPDGYRHAASWPPHEGVDDGDVQAGPDPGERRQPVVHGGEATGLLRVWHQPPRDLSRLERRLLDAYAAQSGQVVRMLALRAALQERRAELAARSGALREVNAQLVEARALERRLLERDLHDGGQQHLLVLALGVELARQQSVRSPAASRATLERAQLTAERARASLLGLADGLTPRLLATEGLAAALRAALSDVIVPVLVRTTGGDDETLVTRAPMPPAVAEALFYVAVEATQNATKHAGSPEVTVDVASTGGGWSVVVSDRGSGFDPHVVPGGSGLAGMRGRLEALAGRLDVRSSPGAGTRVTARVPWPGGVKEGGSDIVGNGTG